MSETQMTEKQLKKRESNLKYRDMLDSLRFHLLGNLLFLFKFLKMFFRDKHHS